MRIVLLGGLGVGRVLIHGMGWMGMLWLGWLGRMSRPAAWLTRGEGVPPTHDEAAERAEASPSTSDDRVGGGRFLMHNKNTRVVVRSITGRPRDRARSHLPLIT